MDRRKLNMKTKVNASTLIEVIIAMVTIVIVFGIAMMIYSNVIRSSVSVKKIRAQAILRDIMERASNSATALQNDSFTLDGLVINQTVKPYRDDKNLNEVDLNAYDSNQQLQATLKQVKIMQDE